MLLFASVYHPWKYVFHAANELGHRLLAAYQKMLDGSQVLRQDQIVAVDGGPALGAGPSDASEPPAQSGPYSVVCLGGTFDHLHPGHKLLLTAGARLLRVPGKGEHNPPTFIIGITGDELLRNKKYAEYVQPWDERAMNVIDFLSSILPLSKEDGQRGSAPRLDRAEGEVVAWLRNDTVRVQCVRIHDPFGPTITREDIDALIVSGETKSGGAAVNDKRAERGWPPLEIFEVDVISAEDLAGEPAGAEDFASKISSTAIRQQIAESRN